MQKKLSVLQKLAFAARDFNNRITYGVSSIGGVNFYAAFNSGQKGCVALSSLSEQALMKVSKFTFSFVDYIAGDFWLMLVPQKRNQTNRK